MSNPRASSGSSSTRQSRQTRLTSGCGPARRPLPGRAQSAYNTVSRSHSARSSPVADREGRRLSSPTPSPMSLLASPASTLLPVRHPMRRRPPIAPPMLGALRTAMDPHQRGPRSQSPLPGKIRPGTPSTAYTHSEPRRISPFQSEPAHPTPSAAAHEPRCGTSAGGPPQPPPGEESGSDTTRSKTAGSADEP